MEWVFVIGEEEKYFEFVSVSPNTNLHLLPGTRGHTFQTHCVQVGEIFLVIEMLNYLRYQAGMVPWLSVSQVDKEVEVALGVGVLGKIAKVI